MGVYKRLICIGAVLIIAGCCNICKALKDDIREVPSVSYESGVCDCSNKTAMLKEWLEWRGWEVKIVVTQDKHALLLIDNCFYFDPIILIISTTPPEGISLIFADFRAIRPYFDEKTWEMEWKYEKCLKK